MRQDTTDLLEYVSATIDSDIDTKRKQGFPKEEIEKCKKALSFLLSLPDVEERLREGGYVPDKNGTLLCHGDKVWAYIPSVIEGIDAKKEATLTWNSMYFKFQLECEIDGETERFDLDTIPNKWIEKI